MPLSEAPERELMHRRSITLNGYARTDGLYDIEGHLTDIKTYPIDNQDRGRIAPGEPLHEMWLRLTVSADLTIVACEAVTDNAPFTICPQATANFSKLAGLSIRPGFLRAAAERVGGTKGCTHIREMLQQVATVAFQTTSWARNRPQPAESGRRDGETALVDSCYAYRSDGPVVARRWPELFTGSAAE